MPSKPPQPEEPDRQAAGRLADLKRLSKEFGVKIALTTSATGPELDRELVLLRRLFPDLAVVRHAEPPAEPKDSTQ